MPQPDTIIDAEAHRRIRARDRTYGISAAHASLVMEAAGYEIRHLVGFERLSKRRGGSLR